MTPTDSQFLAKARSSRVCCLCLTQNLPGLISAVGGPTPRESVDAICGNFATKVFLANTDPTTTEWCSAQIGKALKFNISAQSSDGDTIFGRRNFSVGQQRELQVHPDEFQRLRNGG